MATKAEKRSVLDAIDGMQDEIVNAVSELVQIRSINPGYPGTDYQAEVGGETEANRYLARHYQQLGLKVDLWEVEPKRANLAGVWQGAGGGRSLLFNGHIDTVPTGLPEKWKSGHPLSGKVEGGRIYGRGSCDMKGPLVSQMMAVKAIQAVGLRLKGDLTLSATAGEENMDSATIGAGDLPKRGYRADAAVVSEPSAPPHPLAVVPVSPGLWWVSVTVEGKTSHASTRGETFRAGGLGAEVAVNAIDKGVYLVNAIRKLEDEWGLTKKHPLFKPGHFTMLPGVISGGPHGVQVPFFISDYCTIEYCLWYHPQDTPQEVRQEFENYLRHACELDEWLRHHPPKVEWKVNWPAFSVDPGHAICQAMATAHGEAAQGTRFDVPAKFAGFYAVCDAAFLNPQGIPSIVYGPGSILVAHAADEYVEIDELVVATKAYALLVMDWCEVGG